MCQGTPLTTPLRAGLVPLPDLTLKGSRYVFSSRPKLPLLTLVQRQRVGGPQNGFALLSRRVAQCPLGRVAVSSVHTVLVLIRRIVARCVPLAR